MVHQWEDVPMAFVIAEYFAAIIAIFFSYGPLCFRILWLIWTSVQRANLIIVLTIAAWFSIVARALLAVTAWTNLIIPFGSECQAGRDIACGTCGLFRKLVWITFQFNTLQVAIFYCIVSKFIHRKHKTRLDFLLILLFFLKVISLTIILLTDDTGRIKAISGQSGLEFKSPMACVPLELNQLTHRAQQILVFTYFLVHFVVTMLLSGMLLRRIYKVLHLIDAKHFESVESMQKFGQMQVVVHIVIRHCILTFCLVLIMLLRATLWLLNMSEITHSLWLDIMAGYALFMLFPFANPTYYWFFGWIHQYVFALWKKRHLATMTNLLSPALQMQNVPKATDSNRSNDMNSIPSPLVLLTIDEDDEIENQHQVVSITMQSDVEEKKEDDAKCTDITSLDLLSSDSRRRKRSSSNPFEINFEYLHLFADPEIDSMDVDDSQDSDGKIKNREIKDSKMDLMRKHTLSTASGRERSDSFR